MPAEGGVVLDVSALIAYARSDMQALPLDELLREMREDTGAAVLIPGYAFSEARWILNGEQDALDRLESFADAYGTVEADDPELTKALKLIVSMSGVSLAMAQAMLLTITTDSMLATYTAPTLSAAGFEMRKVLDLDEMFRAE